MEMYELKCDAGEIRHSAVIFFILRLCVFGPLREHFFLRRMKRPYRAARLAGVITSVSLSKR